jgi:hypothetical protein
MTTMKFKTPLVTLVAGLALFGAILGVNLSLNSNEPEPLAADPAETTPAATAEPTPTPTIGDGSGPAATQGTVTYAGTVDGGGSSLAIVVNNGKALAYVCDGRVVEAWLEGTMANGLIELSGAEGSLTGTYGGGKVTGDVTVGAKQWTFTVATVAPPAGAYRSAEGLRDRLDASWVVLPDGTQVGVDRTGGTPRPADPFDLTSGTVTIGGTAVPINRADPK